MKKKLSKSKNDTRKFIFRLKQVVIFLLVLISVFAISDRDIVSAKDEGKRVLFISSYSYAWETVPEQMAGIQEVFSDDVTIDWKFMDTKNVTSKESSALFYQSMKQYLSEVPAYDALIVGDDAAFQFAIQNQQELFHDIPIVFEGVNDIGAAKKACEKDNITGVIESLSYQNTIELAAKLTPDAKQIVAILDDTITGQSERKVFYGYQDKFPYLKFKEINVSKLGQEEIKDKISKYGKESILLYIMCSEDADSNRYVGCQGIEMVTSSADIPVFSIVSIGMGHGFLGGEIVSQKEMGKIAAKMVKRYFDGEDIATIKMQDTSPKTFRFDENVMKKYNIFKSDLPENLEIINHTQTFIEKNKVMIQIMVVVVFVLLLILCIVFWDNMRNRRLNQDLKAAKSSLTKAAHYDNLTGLRNRSVFMKNLTEKMNNEETFALVLYDIDHFKTINDNLGHNNGDIVLKELAGRVQKINDEIFSVYRFAGDEFTAIICSEDHEQIVSYLQKIQEAFQAPIVLEEKEYYIHASIGVSLYPDDAKNQTDLVAAADEAMYLVKKNGRNAYAFYSETGLK